uniref:Uncharacterized protein n=1 Tax=Anguilla anguilla TaxID=7936 RepID=A0A0E9T7N9_ANGAN
MYFICNFVTLRLQIWNQPMRLWLTVALYYLWVVSRCR